MTPRISPVTQAAIHNLLVVVAAGWAVYAIATSGASNGFILVCALLVLWAAAALMVPRRREGDEMEWKSWWL